MGLLFWPTMAMLRAHPNGVIQLSDRGDYNAKVEPIGNNANVLTSLLD